MGFIYEARNINFQTKRGFFGDIIFSKFPIIHAVSMPLDTGLLTHKFQYADVVIRPTDTIRIFNLHLQSVKFNETDYKLIDEGSNNNASQENLQKGKVIIKKLTVSFAKRSAQANAIDAEIKKSLYPTLVCGDFNDLPSSYTYFKVRGNLQDAFLNKGFGLGRTYTGISPLLRIDYILYQGQYLNLLGMHRDKVYYSDHFPQMAWFKMCAK
jgi:endonuclease/exonuclease/phosphatase family metal-dependent hydrolase